MMGGLCLLLNGNMLGGVDRARSGGDRFMFRVGKDNEAKALCRPGASIVDMGGRRIGGFVFVEADACDQAALRDWIAMALGFRDAFAQEEVKRRRCCVASAVRGGLFRKKLG